MRVVISSGHGKYVRGASGNPVPPYLDEVDEVRKVVERVAEYLRERGIHVTTFHDDVSREKNENLERICAFHNAQPHHDLDVSVHMNAYQQTTKPRGCEVWYLTQADLAKRISAAMAKGGHLIDRGAKYSSGLYFLNQTKAPAVLLEVVFVDSLADANLYREHFDAICKEIASVGMPARPARPDLGPNAWHDDITATIFGNGDDEQEGSYGQWIDGDTVGCSFPYKWRDKPRPEVVIEGPAGSITCMPVDVGPWNTDDPDYVLGTSRPLAELQYAEGTEAQNGRVPTNDAGIDLTLPVAEAVGVSLEAGKGKVRWRYK